MLILSNYRICNGFLMFSVWIPERKGPAFPVTGSPLGKAEGRAGEVPFLPGPGSTPASLEKGLGAGSPDQLTVRALQRAAYQAEARSLCTREPLGAPRLPVQPATA